MKKISKKKIEEGAKIFFLGQQKEDNISYVKHLIECSCILPQFKNISPPTFHKFVVFSIIENSGALKPSYVQCANCGIIHKILEIGESEILKGKEDSRVVTKVDDIKISGIIPEKLVGVLEVHDVPLATWQELQFIFEHKQWGKTIILSKERDNMGNIFGKYLLVLGETLYKIEPFEQILE